MVQVATFLVNNFHLPRSCSYLASLEKASPINTLDQPGVCDHVNSKALVQMRMGDMNGDDFILEI